MSKTALITGGSSGIGFELAKLFAADGYQLVLVARRRTELKSAADELVKTYKIPCQIIAADLSEPKEPVAIIEKLNRAKIHVDVLVNNAGFGLLGAFDTADTVQTTAMIQVNVLALTELTKLLLPGMLKRKHGRILNVASVAAFQPGPFMAVYYATKAYVLSFSEALFEELRDTGITVTCLCPGPTVTNFQTRANITGVNLFKSGVMDAKTVAQIAYTALNRGQRLVIPGTRNAILAWLVRFSPKALSLRIVRSIQS